jgi:hypothetical protein
MRFVQAILQITIAAGAEENAGAVAAGSELWYLSPAMSVLVQEFAGARRRLIMFTAASHAVQAIK